MMNIEAELIAKIKNIDAETLKMKARIATSNANETGLHDALRAARTAENKATSLYVNSPSEHTQIKLEAAREFVQSCQKRINLFTSNVSGLNSDTSALWIERKSVLAELTILRINALKPYFEIELENLLEDVSKKSVRLLALAAILYGQDITRLDLTKLLIGCNPSHKSDLLKERESINDRFEKLEIETANEVNHDTN